MKILFLCTGNACRSQIAEGLAKTLGPKGWTFKSAGTNPAGVHPYTIKSMNEIGIDISGQTSKRVTDSMIHWADYVITLCDFARGCIYFPPSKEALHWPTPDPVGTVGTDKKILKAFAKSRNLIQKRLENFFKQNQSKWFVLYRRLIKRPYIVDCE